MGKWKGGNKQSSMIILGTPDAATNTAEGQAFGIGTLPTTAA